MFRFLLVLLISTANLAIAKPRARDLGIAFSGEPGPMNAITDVKGVEVGHLTLIAGESKLGTINGVTRTGITAIWPKGNRRIEGVPAGWDTYNRNGEMTGVAYMDDSGLLEGPVVLTNTESVGVVRDSVVQWFIRHFPVVDEAWLPVVGETDDSWLNDMYGANITRNHVFEVLDHTSGGPVAEGNVGAGTGDVTFRFKAGIGTASRKLPDGYTLGVLVQSNFGRREDFRLAGIPIGDQIKDLMLIENPLPKMYPIPKKHEEHSINVIIATDAPMLPHQLKRVAKRASGGLARLGSIGRNSSGEFFVAFSTQQPKHEKNGIEHWKGLSVEKMDPFFQAVTDATEEAVVNTLAAGETMTGMNGDKVFAVPWDRVLAILKYHNLLKK